MEAIITFDVYLQDPLVAEEDPLFGFEKIEIQRDPVILNGPTSARFAVVDYNASSGSLIPPVQWDEEAGVFKNEGKILGKRHKNQFQFHQVHVWAILQRALKFFEEGQGLGRSIPWGFNGNRLIVVPHAGYGQNAYYDRKSKSLQFYYYKHPEQEGKLIYTCLSADIIHHEFGHAILDGIRPLLIESSSMQTAAFHESLGDITAILLLLRNNKFREKISERFGENLSEVRILSGIADEFGRTVMNKPYLRSANNDRKLSDLQANDSAHHISTVLTGAIFKILEQLSKQYIRRSLSREDSREEDAKKQARTAFWNTIQRMQRMVLQPLDFLPPIEATFKDYALAMLRMEQISNPRDPHGYREVMLKEFVNRAILTPEEEEVLMRPDYIYDRNYPKLENVVAYKIAKSKAAAYQFLDEHRKVLGIPVHRDIKVVDVYQAKKLGRQGRKLPDQLTIQYVWHEEVLLEKDSYLGFKGEMVIFPCGGTLVFDEENNLLHWANKPGTEFIEDSKLLEEGEDRLLQFKENLERLIQRGLIGEENDDSDHFFAKNIFPVTVEKERGLLHFKITPHLDLSNEGKIKSSSWEISL